MANTTIPARNADGIDDLADRLTRSVRKCRALECGTGTEHVVRTMLRTNQATAIVDFGYTERPRRGRIGDRLWLDANANGRQESGERGIEGVKLTLLDAGGAVIGHANNGI